MAATNSNTGSRKNFYTVSYGKLSTKVKEVPEDYTEIKEDELKSITKKVDEINLRKKFVEKTGDYPFVVFYDKIEGMIQNIHKNDYDQGVSLIVDLLDIDEEESSVQMRFYSKYTENLLNRLLNLKSTNSNVVLNPYAIPSEFEPTPGTKIKIYNQGVAVRVNGEKLEVKLMSDNKKLPPLEKITDSNGKETTSRVKRINYLFSEVEKLFSAKEEPVKKEKKAEIDVDVEEDDLPF